MGDERLNGVHASEEKKPGGGWGEAKLVPIQGLLVVTSMHILSRLASNGKRIASNPSGRLGGRGVLNHGKQLACDMQSSTCPIQR